MRLTKKSKGISAAVGRLGSVISKTPRLRACFAPVIIVAVNSEPVFTENITVIIIMRAWGL